MLRTPRAHVLIQDVDEAGKKLPANTPEDSYITGVTLRQAIKKIDDITILAWKQHLLKGYNAEIEKPPKKKRALPKYLADFEVARVEWLYKSVAPGFACGLLNLLCNCASSIGVYGRVRKLQLHSDDAGLVFWRCW